jgi:hypothetical protein
MPVRTETYAVVRAACDQLFELKFGPEYLEAHENYIADARIVAARDGAKTKQIPDLFLPHPFD